MTGRANTHSRQIEPGILRGASERLRQNYAFGNFRIHGRDYSILPSDLHWPSVDQVKSVDRIGRARDFTQPVARAIVVEWQEWLLTDTGSNPLTAGDIEEIARDFPIFRALTDLDLDQLSVGLVLDYSRKMLEPDCDALLEPVNDYLSL